MTHVKGRENYDASDMHLQQNRRPVERAAMPSGPPCKGIPMRLTTFTDYSLRVLMFLAARPGHPATIGAIAEAFGISRNHLMKVVQFLGQQSYLTNVRGRGGGIALAQSPADIRLGALVRLTEADSYPVECFDRVNNRCVITPACRLRGALRTAVAAFYSALDEYTLEDVVRNRRALVTILFPAADVAASAVRS